MNGYEFHRICGAFLDTLVHNKRHSGCRKMIPRSVSTMLFIISGSWHLVICSNLVQWKACQQLTSRTRIKWPSIMVSHYELQIVWNSQIYVKCNQWGNYRDDRWTIFVKRKIRLFYCFFHTGPILDVLNHCEQSEQSSWILYKRMAIKLATPKFVHEENIFRIKLSSLLLYAPQMPFFRVSLSWYSWV